MLEAVTKPKRVSRNKINFEQGTWTNKRANLREAKHTYTRWIVSFLRYRKTANTIVALNATWNKTFNETTMNFSSELLGVVFWKYHF